MQHSSLLCEWEPRILNYRQSGLKAVDWCILNDLPVHRLKYWITKVNKLTKDTVPNPEKVCSHDDDHNWATVKIVDDNRNSNIAICIGSARIEVSPGFDKSLLSDVLQVVTRSC